MSDDETKQILRELLETQKQQLEFMRRMNETSERQRHTYDEATVRYQKEVLDNAATNRISNLIRSLALLGVVIILAYIVVHGLHSH